VHATSSRESHAAARSTRRVGPPARASRTAGHGAPHPRRGRARWCRRSLDAVLRSRPPRDRRRDRRRSARRGVGLRTRSSPLRTRLQGCLTRARVAGWISRF